MLSAPFPKLIWFYANDLNEEVESGFSNGQVQLGFPEQSQSEGRRKKRKSQHGEREITDVFEEVQSKYNDEHARNFYAGRDLLTEDTTISETSVKTLSDNQEDQVLFRSELY
ncbi:hypothetical protein SUGI_0065300 [Cryptomeria japonica]|nr:hypothetical protein SUGI_0065300 [Cryptomeria japonica]